MITNKRAFCRERKKDESSKQNEKGSCFYRPHKRLAKRMFDQDVVHCSTFDWETHYRKKLHEKQNKSTEKEHMSKESEDNIEIAMFVAAQKYVENRKVVARSSKIHFPTCAECSSILYIIPFSNSIGHHGFSGLRATGV